MKNAERTWRGVRPERDGAAPTTVEALMYSLRERGVAALDESDTQRRLAEFSMKHVQEVIARLEKLRPRYSAITPELIEFLKGLT